MSDRDNSAPPKAVAAAARSRGRQDSDEGYVLHSYPFRETSLVIETFTRHNGRVALVARGARRPRSALRGTLRAFQPLTLAWGGKGELRTLYKAEWQGGMIPLTGSPLICGFYLNELLLRLLARDDPHEQLFAAYGATLAALAADAEQAATLRHFEKDLLAQLGYALILDRDAASGEPVQPDARYHYVMERGPVRVADNDTAADPELSGQTLIDIDAGDYHDPVTAVQSKLLMRSVLNHYLGDKPLHTRQLLKDLQKI